MKQAARLGLRAALLLACVAAAAPARADDGRKVYAVIVLDTDAGKAGLEDLSPDMEKDGQNVKKFLEGGIGADYLELKVLKGRDASLRGLNDYLDSIRPARGRDALVCFVSAHGQTVRRNGDEHILALCGTGRKEEVRRSELRDMLLRKGARLTVLLSDSCSDCPADPVRAPDRGLSTFAPSRRSSVAPAFRSLFLEAEGVVDVNGSTEGYYAWSDRNAGGIFTQALHETFVECQSEHPLDWPTFYTKLKAKTEEVYVPWKDQHVRRLEAAGALGAEEREILQMLKTHPPQSPQAFYLAGARLKVTVRGTDGEGVRVVDLPLDSPLRKAGIKVNEVIVKVNGERTPTIAEWKRVVGEKVRTGLTRYTFTVRGADGVERNVEVSL
jgi:hypothetical protein